jgi:hypothetical protein
MGSHLILGSLAFCFGHVAQAIYIPHEMVYGRRHVHVVPLARYIVAAATSADVTLFA